MADAPMQPERTMTHRGMQSSAELDAANDIQNEATMTHIILVLKYGTFIAV
jgi:hypothetical protein